MPLPIGDIMGLAKKPPSEREGDRVSGGRSPRDFEVFDKLCCNALSLADSSLPEGAFGRARASLGAWASPEAFVIQRRNLR